MKCHVSGVVLPPELAGLPMMTIAVPHELIRPCSVACRDAGDGVGAADTRVTHRRLLLARLPAASDG